MRESKFQSQLVKKIQTMFPDAIVIRNNPQDLQGVPDITVLRGPHWAALEVKNSSSARKQPNQEYWVDRMNAMGYATFVYPENEREVLDHLQETLRT